MRMPRPKHSTVVAYLALFFAMGGTAIAATGGNLTLGHRNTANRPTVLKNAGYGPALKLANGHKGSAPFTVGGNSKVVPRLNANYLQGHPASAFELAGTLRPGHSESGMFSAAEGTATGSGGWIGAGITYPRPLKTAIANSHIIGVDGAGPVDHCPGVGRAERGYLCLYNTIRSGVGTGYGYSSSPAFSSPSVGAVVYWPVTGSYAYAGGEWTVTAP